MGKTPDRKGLRRGGGHSIAPVLQHSSTPCSGRRAVFVDRDGTLNEMVYDETHGLLDSPRRPEQVKMLPGAAGFIRGCQKLGYLVVVITNQPGIAKGTLSMEELAAVNARVVELLKADGAAWDDMRFCPHHPKGDEGGRAEYVQDCACRKPRPGMILDAAQKHGIDCAQSWVVGDGLNDVQAGRAAGCRTILVTRLKAEQVERFFGPGNAEPDAIVSKLEDALAVIKKATRPGQARG